MKLAAPIGLLAALFAVTVPALAGTLVVNGGFETGDLTGWTANGWSINNTNTTGPYSGDFYAETGCTEFGCFLSQTLPTDPGALYDLNFWYNSGPDFSDDGPGVDAVDLELRVFWDGNQIDDILGNTNGYANFDYTVSASTNSTELAFEGLQVPSFDGIDDVSVTASAPEPGSIMLFVAGLAAVVARRRWRRA